jgi:hypothetical protein
VWTGRESTAFWTPFSEPKISGDDANSMVRVPGKVSVNVLVERRAARVPSYLFM